ncbi:MAG: Xaa-Pro dipeptidase [Gemmatimonadaceae bacterium]
MVDTRAARLAALREAIAAAHLDGLLLSGRANIRYTTGFSGSSALVMVSARDVVLITDFRYQTQASAEVGDFARVAIEGQSLWAGLWQILPTLAGLEVIGFEGTHLPHRDFQRLLDQGQRWQWRPTADVVEGLRERKDDGELALIAQAAVVATTALENTLPQLKEGMSELQVAGRLELAIRDAGGEGFPFPTIVASGSHSALPHAQPTTRRIVRGDFLLMDFGAEVSGYCSDVTRTVVVGRASDEQRAIYGVVREANAIAVSQIRAGSRGRDADALARGYIERCGYGPFFGHSLGHGVGLEVHEAPRLARTSDSFLPAGAVVTVEPGVYRPGWGGIRIEDDVFLGADGPRVLTNFPRELLEVA